MALFATTTTTDIWDNCGTDANPTPCPVSTSSSESYSSTPLSTTIESSTATIEPTRPHHPLTSSVGYILIGVSIPIVIILIGACVFYWRRRRRAAAAAAAAAPPLEPAFPTEKDESNAEKGYGDVRLDTAVSELDPGPGGLGKVFIAELDGSSMVGCMELDSSPVMSMSPGSRIKSNLFVSGAGVNTSIRNGQFSAVSGAGVGAGAGTISTVRGSGFASAGANAGPSAGSDAGSRVGAGVATGVNSNAFVAELEAPLDASGVDKKRLELEGNDAPQITEVEIPSSILFTLKKGPSGEN